MSLKGEEGGSKEFIDFKLLISFLKYKDKEMDGSSKPAYSFVLAGKVNDPIFHKCLACLKHLEKERPKEVKLEVLQFFETQWEEYLKSV